MIRTGDQHRDSVRGIRDVYMNGGQVAVVTTHPMFKSIIDIRGRLYDMQQGSRVRQGAFMS